ncbi:hypothetical protein HPT25_27665 [Bacillus sp. BRMEA1]|uniref:hypothetical protein n=1 Tax=Neobacillus endophyticus TaxID=2738405 RepID=UPI001566F88F|nr:hypothetical protein [Neobacillus endophyticus]NRD81074.1 hypothetical protein [Neobacillus endophyticus]
MGVSEYTVNDEIIKLKVDCGDSGIIIKKYSYEYKNHSLYITLKGNAFSSSNKGIDTLSIKNTFNGLDNIYLFDGKSSKKVWSQSNKLQSTIQKLEGDNASEKNYLFYNEADDLKTLRLNFKSDYNEEPIIGVTLYKDGEPVSTKVQIIDTSIHDGGHFTIGLKQYVQYFNEIKLLTDQNKTLTLKTGQYFFEKVNIKNEIPEKERLSLESYNTWDDGAKFRFNASFSYTTKGLLNYQVYLPKGSLNNLKIKENHSTKEQGNRLNITVNCDSPKKVEHAASYEMMIVQNNGTKQYVMNTVSVAIQPDDKK